MTKDTVIPFPKPKFGLRLVVSNNDTPVRENLTYKIINQHAGFTAEVKKDGKEGHYLMLARDPSHYLECDLVLKIPKNNDDKVVACQFPTILDDQLNAAIWGDELLHSSIMTQFQMRIVEQLLLFCVTHHLKYLVLYCTPQNPWLAIDEHFVRGAEMVRTKDGQRLKLLISASQKILKKWIKCMGELNEMIGKDLWKYQDSNSVIRSYLKSQVVQNGVTKDDSKT